MLMCDLQEEHFCRSCAPNIYILLMEVIESIVREYCGCFSTACDLRKYIYDRLCCLKRRPQRVRRRPVRDNLSQRNQRVLRFNDSTHTMAMLFIGILS